MVRLLATGRSTVVFGLCPLAIALSLAAAAPAGAVVANIGGHGYGITPRAGAGKASLVAAFRASHAGARRAAAHPFDGAPLGGTELENLEGGPVMHSTKTHVIFWDPTSQFSSTTKGIVEKFFGDVAHDSGLASNVFAVAGQYTDPSGHAAYESTFAGALTDSDVYPSSGNCTVPSEGDIGPYPTCLFDGQLQHELSDFIAEKGLPKGPTQLYFLLLPHKVATCFDETPEEEIKFGKICSNNFFCAYHSSINPGTAGEIIYADIPFSLLDSGFAKGCQDDGHNANIQQPNPDNAGGEDTETRFADVALKYISHEAIEAITDPLVNFDTAWVDGEGLEIGDKCNGVTPDKEEDGVGYDPNAFLPVLGGTIAGDSLFNQSINTGSYYLQSEWDNAGKACLMEPLALSEASFTSGSATAGVQVSFSGSATDRYGAFAPTWTFGDGATATGASPSHTFAAAGDFTVTMMPKDALTGSTGPSTSHTVTVASPPSPASTTTATATGIAAATPHLPPDSAFTVKAGSFNARTGVITIKAAVADAGTFAWLATFPNGKFGAFTSARKCKSGFIRLAGKCRPAKIIFAKESESVAGAGTVTITLKPSQAAGTALRNALKKGKALLVSGTLSFQSSRGGLRVTHPLGILVRLRK